MKVLDRFDMGDCKPRSTPCENKLTFSDGKCSNSKHNYREMVGSLIYIMMCTRPDLCFVISKLSQFLDKPSKECFVNVKHVFQYLRHTHDYGLCFRKCKVGLEIVGYADSDWGNTEDRKSVSGYCFTLNKSIGPMIAWKSKKQNTVALSTCEAEYMALSAATQESLFLKQLLNCMDLSTHDKAFIFGDNQSALALAKNNMCNQRSKHIDIRYHFIRSAVSEGRLEVLYVPSQDNVADCLTKPLDKYKLRNFAAYMLGL